MQHHSTWLTGRLLPLLVLSGMAALCCESVWLRRLSLLTGSAGLSATVTLALYMGGLGLGGLWAGKRQWNATPASYGWLEFMVALWALAFPYLLQLLQPFLLATSGLLATFALAAPLLIPPAFLHGATLPALAPSIANPRDLSLLYAANTLGAVLGVLLAAFWWMPSVGIRNTELIAGVLSAVVGCGALALSYRWPSLTVKHLTISKSAPWSILMAAGVAGGVAMALEIVWTRLAALLIGGSVYAMSVVLAIFLAGIALGAAWGRRLGPKALVPALGLLGILAIAGTISWRFLPHGFALMWALAGDGSQLLAGSVLLSIAMAGAPIASGVVFSACLQSVKDCRPENMVGQLLAANTFGGVLGVVLAGSFGLPWLGIRGLVLLLAGLTVGVALWFPSPYRKLGFAMCLITLILSPRWDPAIYAVGLYNRIGEFVDHSPRAIEKFAHDGWELRFYEDGKSASVAVGQSTRSGNLWLSINGKVDASTGDDMPTQQLSGSLPVAIARHNLTEKLSTLVIGLASGVTAAETVATGTDELTIIELEPAVVRASALFHEANQNILSNPKSQLIVGDARAHLRQHQQRYHVIISEPSNPWMTGISNLFTSEYWHLGKQRLHADGVFCQWVQLYALPPEAFRSLVRSYIEIFPNTWMFETIPGVDALLISAPELPSNLPLQPSLTPTQLRNLAAGARRNTDDHPWIEFEAPKWINRTTGRKNQQLIEQHRR